MIKSLCAGAFALAACIPTAVEAYNPTASISLGDATDIRSCPIDGDMSRGVCYNQTREGSVSILDVPVLPISWSSTRAYSVDCSRRVFSRNTLHGQVGAKYCPIRGQLAPAPFLR